MIAKTPLHEGLASFSNANFAKLNVGGARAFLVLISQSNHDVRLGLLRENYFDDWLDTFIALLQEKKITQLSLNVGWYERTIQATVKPIDLHKFWRKVKPLNRLLS